MEPEFNEGFIVKINSLLANGEREKGLRGEKVVKTLKPDLSKSV